ncbi:DUF159-domain-containing protein [Coprinopsis marcescibilis]|uniref:DUF159-domain-containing protein n=1 Tax=Coprinopsis marcescibilis TaxID=230819 RepID=A0A5C3KWY3_COPMA|nr:DUF159-domain-containing protein [Coprinopsis marcescibilis]
MCGRFALRANRRDVQNQPNYGLDIEEWEDENDFVPRYNIAPRSNAPVIRRRDAGPSGSGSNDALIVQTMKWGLVPHWSKVEDKTLSTTNARSENLIAGGGMWGTIKGKKRCAIPCQGYFEWLTKGKDKLPHFTKRKDGALLMMAGLYDCATIEGRTLWTFAIVTTDANKEFSWLHDRQPVFLMSKEDIDKWLDTSSQTWTPDLNRIVQPYHGSVQLQCYQVPKEVGKIGTESSTFIEPVANRKDGIQAMFAKQQNPQTASPTKASSSQPSTSKAVKRPRTPTPDEEEPVLKKVKAGESQSTKGAGKAPNSPRKSPTKAKASPQKKAGAVAGTAKITNFFAKGK